MPGKYERKTTHQTWTKESLLNAVAQIKTGKISYRKASALYNIPRTTLMRRIKENNIQEVKLGRFKQIFTAQQEQELKEHLLEMEKRFFGLTQKEFRRMVFTYATVNNISHTFNKTKGLAGKDWLRGFLHRNPGISLRNPENTSFARASGFNKVVVNKFFDLLTELMEKYNFSASRVYNVDETSVTTVPNKSSKIMAKTGKRQIGVLTSAERGVTVTCAVCCNAAGFFIPPLMIFPRVRHNPAFINGCPPETLLVCHKTGWMQSDIFSPTWFNHFVKYSQPTEKSPVLLILDGHSTHSKNLDLLLRARQNHVHILCLPPHTSHKIQPLDRTFMKPLSTYYSQQCQVWLRSHPGQTINLLNMGEIFGKAYLRAATPENAISGFRATGILPLNRFVFSDEEFTPALTTDKTVSNCDVVDKEQDSSDEESSYQSNSNESRIVRVEDISDNWVEVPAQIEIIDVEPPSTPPHQSNQSLEEGPCCSKSNEQQIQSLEEGPCCSKSIEQQIQSLEEGPCCSKSNEQQIAVSKFSPFSSGTNKKYFSPRDLVPIPKAKFTSKCRKTIRNKGKTAILTASPYMSELSEKNRINEKVNTAKKEIFNENRKKKKIKKNKSSADAVCLYCNSLFSESKPGEKWIQCNSCHEWAHEECSSFNKTDLFFVCETCS